MLEPWLADARAQRLIDAMSAACDLDLARYGTVAGAQELRDTAVAQPLIVAASLIAAALLREELARAEDPGSRSAAAGHQLVAGHSVGELAAAALAGVLDDADAVRLAAVRGRAMAAASALADTGMAAVLPVAQEDMERAAARTGLTVANHNGADQYVVAGERAALEELPQCLPVGVRCVPLPVAGAFHTRFMQPALPQIAAAAGSIQPHDTRVRLLSNADGEPVDAGPMVMERLVGQTVRPVRWDLCMETMRALGVRAVIELPPAGTLAGLVRRVLPDVLRVPLRGPQDLPAAAALITAAAG